MHIEAKIVATEAYYREAYAETIKRKKLKKWEPFLAFGLLLFGLLLYRVNSSRELWFIPAFFVAAGVYELFKIYHSKRKWLNERLNSPLANKSLSLTFTDDCILHAGPLAEGSFGWETVRQVEVTEKGLFLIPENGLMIYLPRHAFATNKAFAEVVSRLQQKLA